MDRGCVRRPTLTSLPTQAMVALLQHLLMESAQRRPGRIAVRFGVEAVRYGELDRLSNQMGIRRLRRGALTWGRSAARLLPGEAAAPHGPGELRGARGAAKDLDRQGRPHAARARRVMTPRLRGVAWPKRSTLSRVTFARASVRRAPPRPRCRSRARVDGSDARRPDPRSRLRAIRTGSPLRATSCP